MKQCLFYVTIKSGSSSWEVGSSPSKKHSCKRFGWISPPRGRTLRLPYPHTACDVILRSAVWLSIARSTASRPGVTPDRCPQKPLPLPAEGVCVGGERVIIPLSSAMRIIILQQDSRTEDMVGDWVWWKVVDLWTHFRPKQRGGDVVADDNPGSSGPWSQGNSLLWSPSRDVIMFAVKVTQWCKNKWNLATRPDYD